MTHSNTHAQSADVSHPVMDYGIDTARAELYEQAAAPIAAMTDEMMLALIPPLGYVSFCECPACYGGSQGNNIFTWTIDKPEQLQCKYCDEIVFPNPKYAEKHTLEGVNALGENLSLPYYLHPPTQVTHFFSMHLWRYKRAWLLDQCQALARAYLATGNEDYARKAVLVLDRFAQVYPHYPALHNRYSRGIRFCKPQEPPFNWDAGRWGYFHNEIPKPVIAIYDMVYESPAFDALSARRGYDVRKALEDDFLRETYRIAAASTFHVSNVVGYDVAGVAILGRVINEPDYVHQALGWMMDNVEQGFFRDGIWHESPSYHYMTVGGLKSAFSVLDGYSDPPGYVNANSGERLDDFTVGEDIPFFAKALHAPEVLDFPNGCSTPVHDTWPGQRRSAPRNSTTSTVAPAFGHASLGRGTGAAQMQAQLHFGGTYGHHHLDALNLTLFACRREMLPDLGYTWTQMRSWTVSTLAHNTVVLDRQNQRGGRDVDGSLMHYFPDVDGISLVSANAPRVYDRIEGPDGYLRTLIMIPVNESEAYVVDIFRVAGGTTHDWALHGDADTDTTAHCHIDLPTAKQSMLEAGEEWTEPQTSRDRANPYGMVRDPRMGKTDRLFATDFRYPEDPGGGIRVHLAAGSCEVFLGRSPSVRRTGIGAAADMRKAFDYWMPQLIVRRQGEAPLRSTFAAVHEPFQKEPFLQHVRELAVRDNDAAAALEITHASGVDTIVSLPSTATADAGTATATAGDVRLDGRFGIVRQTRDRGRVLAMTLLEGRELACGEARLQAETARYEGRIEAVQRHMDGDDVDAFVINTTLPAGTTLRGAWLIVTYPNGWSDGHPVDRVDVVEGKTRVCLAADPALRMHNGETREVYFPQRTFHGPLAFRIPLATSLKYATNAEKGDSDRE